MKTMLISAAVTVLFFISTQDRFIGRWETKPSPKGNVTGIVFKPDNSFEAYINRKPFVSGTYTLKENVLSFVDQGCNGKQGVYEIVLFSNDDSLRFQPINDECAERKAGMSKTIMGRVKL